MSENVDRPKSTDPQRILEVKGLRTSFYTRAGVIKAVTGVDFHVNKGEVLGLVGESGCGKSVTSLTILGLVGEPGKVEGGEVLFGDQDLLQLSSDEMRKIRGDRIAMIFQQPQSSLNPVMKVGPQISEALMIHRDLDEKAARARSLELMDMVGIPDANRRYEAYPHEMSGGMAQRVMIAIALSFLGLGIGEPTPEWGAMIGRDFNSIFTRPLLVLAPAFMLTTMVLAFNLLGDGIRDALDPRLNR